MHPVIKNILAVFAGAIFGSAINMAIIMLGTSIIPPPEGADVTTVEGLKASLHFFEPRHFIMPFLAHAIGTLVGALLAAKIAASQKMGMAMCVGILFLMGGIANVIMLPSPLWFSITDLVGAYLPVAFLAGRFITKRSGDLEY